jgi:hypothetical protein
MELLKSYDATFVFLGQRNYVHGTSMTHGLLTAVETWSLGAVERVQLNLHSPLKGQGRYDLFDSESWEASVKKEYNAMFRLQCNNQGYIVELKQRGEPVTVAEPYDEEKLIAACKIMKHRKSATLLLQSNTLAINAIIALNKKLVNTLFPSEGYEQWFLARYDLAWDKMSLMAPALLEIEVIGNIGASNTNSAIKLAGEPVGSVYFSRKVK